MATATVGQEKPNLETYSLVWLDNSVGSSHDTIQAQQYLQNAINYIKLFRQADKCEQYIRSLSKIDRVIMIVSGQLGREIVPKIHNLRQIHSIYVYCMNKQKNEEWTRPFNEVKRIIVDLRELAEKIRDDQAERERNKINEPILFDIFQSHPTTDELNNSFLYSNLLINCLLQTNSSVTDKTNLLSLCKELYEGNENELKILEEFEQNYFPSRSLWWFTRSTCLYRLLKKALDTQNIKLLLLFRFFIRDIQRQLEKNKPKSPIRGYFGLLMSHDEFKIVKSNMGGFILFNSFLLTSNKQQIKTYYSQIDFSNDYERIVFEIEADPRLENIKPFSTITTQSFNPNEEQILFMLGSIFQLIEIQPEHNGISLVRLKLCSETNKDLKSVFYQTQIKDTISFGEACCTLKRYDEAERYYRCLLKNLPPDHEDTILYYDALGNLKKQQKEYDASIKYFEKSLTMKTKILEPGHPDTGDSYINIGGVYLIQKEFKKAFQTFDHALMIYKEKLGDDHPKVALCLTHMGNVYRKDRKDTKALDLYQKALQIYEKGYTLDNPEVAVLYKNIGRTYENLKDIDKALDNYNQATDIYENSTFKPKFDIGQIYKSVGDLHEQNKEFKRARTSYETALKFFSEVLSPTDPQINLIQQNIQRVTAKIKP